MNNIPYRLSSRNSFSSSLRSSHIPSIDITNNLLLVASLIAASRGSYLLCQKRMVGMVEIWRMKRR